MGAADEATLWARPVFSVGDATYTWADVAAFARRGDGWSRLRREARDGLACRRAGCVPSPVAVDQAARAFRYARRLLTADETGAWLGRRGLDVEGWMDYLRREVLRVEHAGDVVADVPDSEVDAVVWVTGWCGGHFESLSVDLARRVAAHVRLFGTTPEELSGLDDVLERFAEAVVVSEAVQAVVARRRLDWLRIDLDEAWFDSEGAAREAALGVRFDRMAMSEVCALSGARQTRRTTRLDQLHEPLRTAVLGAREGDIVGPVGTDDRFVLARVESKTLPSVEDPDVRRLAEGAVVETALRHEVEERVRWHDR